MKILLTGATGYIGQRLLPALLKAGHQVVCCVRDKKRFPHPAHLLAGVEVIEVDFLKSESLLNIPYDIDGAYYLMHAMASDKDYSGPEAAAAENFKVAMKRTKVQHVIYLSGIVNEKALSKHLTSRKAVEEILSGGDYHFTTLRAGIIIGSGSASFEIIRDLVEKLPLMITPKWLNTKCQPIGIRDVIAFLSKSLFNPATYDQNFDIGGPDILSYKEMLLGYARIRGLRRKIWIVPVMTPKLSSYWLYFVTATSYKLASALVSSMKVEVICRNNQINRILGIHPMNYQQALEKTLARIENDDIVSSWKDAWSSGDFKISISSFLEVPSHGCFVDRRAATMANRNQSIERIWQLGGQHGWYYANGLWKIRGFMDKLVGGVGLRRGRTHKHNLQAGDALDFWRVLYADKEEGRLLLFAEMKLPGEAWLEFKTQDGLLWQSATFRPRGWAGRLYWFAVYPFHGLIFRGLLQKLSE